MKLALNATAVALLSGALLASGGVAASSANAADYTADWRLVAAPDSNGSFTYSVRLGSDGDYVDFAIADATGADIYHTTDFVDISGLDGPDPSYYGYRESGGIGGPLASGDYKVAVRVTSSGQWHCSIYSQSGCYWTDAIDVTRTYHLAWRGVATTVRPDAIPSAPTTSTRSASTSAMPAAIKVTSVSLKVKRHAHKLTATGTVKVAKHATKGVKVKLQKKVHGEWKTVKTVKSKAKGKVTVKINSTKKLTLRLYVPATSKYRAAKSKTVKR